MPSLKEIAATKGLLYGTAVNGGHVARNPKLAEVLLRECACITGESDMKWTAIRPEAAKFEFTRGDRLAKFAKDNGLLLRGHTLVWHTLPAWVDSIAPQDAEKILVEHITTVASRYEGQADHWDVVNEVASPNGLRDTIWLRHLGEKYIDLAFQLAKESCSATRFYNENRMEYDIPEMDKKRASVLKLLERLVSSGVPIEGLGIQAHLFPDLPFSESKYSAFLRDVGELGLKILITECDVTDIELPADIAERDQRIADTFKQFLDVALAEPKVIGVLTWGLSDAYTWINSTRPRRDGLASRPLPFDDQVNPKPAYQAIYDAIANAPAR
ncbi:endo-1,4-beta-xylanase [[Phormidium] sp. ETS-05]|uniref:endo-1,4-beta-xylanase n=1 Tax=[Phormidium] sp. ETS-05 TaxID=222819 RepID=UPI0018EEF4E6|nr:endo-1,4-beta-xylanase [[Phormidium] sp. ETS-05]